MPEVQINIGGRPFAVACQEGEEHFLQSAAQLLDNEAATLMDQIGRMSRNRRAGLKGRDQGKDLLVPEFGHGMGEGLRDGRVFGAARMNPDHTALRPQSLGMAKPLGRPLGRGRFLGAGKLAHPPRRIVEAGQETGSPVGQLPSSSVGDAEASSSRNR